MIPTTLLLLLLAILSSSVTPTEAPSRQPTNAPTEPTMSPTGTPTTRPTAGPTAETVCATCPYYKSCTDPAGPCVNITCSDNSSCPVAPCYGAYCDPQSEACAQGDGPTTCLMGDTCDDVLGCLQTETPTPEPSEGPCDECPYYMLCHRPSGVCDIIDCLVDADCPTSPCFGRLCVDTFCVQGVQVECNEGAPCIVDTGCPS